MSCVAGLGQEKIIHLRNGAIKTPPRNNSVTPTGGVGNGLYLLQFESAFQQEWNYPLAGLNVELVRSVPEHAFVAHLRGTDLARLRELPFVRWVGEYGPQYKIFKALLQNPNEEKAVSVLFSLKATGNEVARARRWLSRLDRASHTAYGTILHGHATARQINQIASSPAVLWIEPSFKARLYDEISTKIVGGTREGNRSIVQSKGFEGKGVTVAVADSGLQDGVTQGMHPDLADRVDGFFHYGALDNAADEHSHGTHVTGIVAGDGATGETDDQGYLYGLGIAPEAHIIAQRLFDGLGGYEPPPTFEVLTHDAVRMGAEIGSNSWGDDVQGRYDISAMEFDALVRDADKDTPGDQQYILEFSAGNAGPGEKTIGSPAVGKNVIATGASQNNRGDFFIYAEGEDAMADFSSRGPCEDGRIKPDLVAPGTWIASLQSSSASDENAWLGISPNYQYQGGTSQAGPQVSGAAAVFVQYYRQLHAGQTPSPALVKAALINSAVDMEEELVLKPVPNDDVRLRSDA